MHVSFCPELDIASCGETVTQAKKNLIEVLLINTVDGIEIKIVEQAVA